jgi:hypothetical protein
LLATKSAPDALAVNKPHVELRVAMKSDHYIFDRSFDE